MFTQEKTKEIQERNRKLVEKYPFLKPLDAFTGKDIEDYDYTYIEMEGDIPDGWWKRFGIPLCDDLKECLEKAGCLDKFRFMQVKEKYGQIRLYDNGVPRECEWHDHLYAWEYISEHTCVKCGKFPVPMLYDSWISPWCSECYKQNLTENGWNIPDEERLKSITEKGWDGRMQEYIEISVWTRDGEKKTRLIDMKPYYKKIGWDFKPGDLISLEEMRFEKQ